LGALSLHPPEWGRQTYVRENRELKEGFPSILFSSYILLPLPMSSGVRLIVFDKGKKYRRDGAQRVHRERERGRLRREYPSFYPFSVIFSPSPTFFSPSSTDRDVIPSEESYIGSRSEVSWVPSCPGRRRSSSLSLSFVHQLLRRVF